VLRPASKRGQPASAAAAASSSRAAAGGFAAVAGQGKRTGIGGAVNVNVQRKENECSNGVIRCAIACKKMCTPLANAISAEIGHPWQSCVGRCAYTWQRPWQNWS